MDDLLKAIKNLLIIVILLGSVTAGIDYLRIKSGEIPMFNIKTVNNTTRIQTFRGLFYIGERKLKSKPEEPLTDSTNIKYRVLIFDIDVPKQFKKPTLKYTIETEEQESCNEKSILYYQKDNIKIYTECINSIKIVTDNKTELKDYMEKDNKIIDNLINQLGYTGFYNNTNTLVFTSRDNSNFTNHGLTIYQCNNEVQDIYITPKNSEYKTDFCTQKNDNIIETEEKN